MTDLVTLVQVKSTLNIPNATTTYDAELTAAIATATSVVLNGDGKFRGIGYFTDTTVTEDHDGGRGVLLLREHPVRSITSVTEYAGVTAQVFAAQVTGAAEETYGYRADLKAGMITRTSGIFTPGYRNVRVVYHAGWALDATAVAALADATAKLVGFLWKPAQFGVVNEAGGVTATGGALPGYLLPYHVLGLLAPFERPAVFAA